MAHEEYVDHGCVCLNGHPITGYVSRERNRVTDFCGICGAKTLLACPRCKKPIQGALFKAIRLRGWQPPAYCHACGKPLPWTLMHAKALKDLIDETDELSEAERRELSQSVRDIMTHTARSDIAVLRIKKAMRKLGQKGGAILLALIEKMACEYVAAKLANPH